MIDAPAGPVSVGCHSWRPLPSAKAVSVSPSPTTAIPPPTATYACPDGGHGAGRCRASRPLAGQRDRPALRRPRAGGAAAAAGGRLGCPETRPVTGKNTTASSTTASTPCGAPAGGQRPGSRLAAPGAPPRAGSRARPAPLRPRADRSHHRRRPAARPRLAVVGRSDNQGIAERSRSAATGSPADTAWPGGGPSRRTDSVGPDTRRYYVADRAPLPYDFLPPVPSFTVTSEDIADGEMMGNEQLYNSFGMTARTSHRSCPGPASPRDQVLRGHLLRPRRADRLRVLALAADRHPGLGDVAPAGAGAAPAALPAGAFHVRNDYGTKDFGGAAPPAGRPAAPVRVRRARASTSRRSASTPTSRRPSRGSTCDSTRSPARCSSRSTGTRR